MSRRALPDTPYMHSVCLAQKKVYIPPTPYIHAVRISQAGLPVHTSEVYQLRLFDDKIALLLDLVSRQPWHTHSALPVRYRV